MRRLLAPLLLLPLLLTVATTAAAQTPAPTPAPAATVTRADDGSTVRLRPGDLLDVRLGAVSGAAWRGTEGLETGTRTLQLLAFRTGLDGDLTARLRALAPLSEPQRLRAETDHPCFSAPTPCARPSEVWSLSVVVDDGPALSGEVACQQVARPTASPAPGTIFLTAADDSRTVSVPRDGQVVVQLDGCASPYALPPQGSRPLFRAAAGLDRSRGVVDAFFRPQGEGTGEVGAGYDAPCLHTEPACALGQRAYAVTVQVGLAQGSTPPPCPGVVLSGPARVVAGQDVPLVGRTQPGSAVEVLFRRRGAQDFTVRRSLVADREGRFATSYAAVDDHRWYARTSPSCTSTPGLTQAVPVVSGPAVVRPGQTVVLRVQAPTGVVTRVFFRGSGEPFTARRTLTGPGTVSYRAADDQRWYAATPSVQGPAGLTQVR